jgi:hypothetical protein
MPNKDKKGFARRPIHPEFADDNPSRIFVRLFDQFDPFSAICGAPNRKK